MVGPLMTVRELADALRVSKFHAYTLLRRGTIRSVRIGRLRRVREEDLRHFIQGSGPAKVKQKSR